MKGVINKGIQEMVVSRFGHPAWEEIKRKARVTEDLFLLTEDYSDEGTIRLVHAAAEVLDLPTEGVMVEFGRFWFTHVAPVLYPSYLALAGSSPLEMLKNVDRIHRLVTRNIPSSSPPSFQVEEEENGMLRFHYFSTRGLCPVVRGLVEGIGEYFGKAMAVTEVECVHRGDHHCIFEVFQR